MTKTATNKSVRLMAVFGLASLAAVGLGAAVCALSGVSAASWGRNLAAWLVGAVIAAALAAAGGASSRRGRRWRSPDWP
ncbi:hypothetical protein [Brevundimonas aurantiaca]|uniref:hypothetical protein n=1 Tax=Brevundimonas aurantiaca TaxID=74316 RepID=UPI001CD76100|nr:hypothetical protein [Brevundimonas aurantiaca]